MSSTPAGTTRTRNGSTNLRRDIPLTLSVSEILKSFPSPPGTPLPSRPGTSSPPSVGAHISAAEAVHSSCTGIQTQLAAAEATLNRALRSTRRRILGRLTRSQRGEVYDRLAGIDTELRRVRGRVKGVEASYRRLVVVDAGFAGVEGAKEGAKGGGSEPASVQRQCEQGIRELKALYADCEMHWRRIRKSWEDSAAWEARYLLIHLPPAEESG